MEDPSKRYFGKLTDRERAIFEGAVTLGMLYHQFVGTPLRNPRALEQAMQEAALAQPFVERAEVRISAPKRRRWGPFDYAELQGRMLTISLVARYGKAKAKVGMRYVKELGYPLMFVR